MRWIDLPPVWLIAALICAWVLGQLVPLDLNAWGPWAHWLGTALLWAGLALIAIAAVEFLRARTSIIPRDTPKALITSGIYRFSRNPIYLADALILAGLCLRWDAILGLFLVPLFVWWIQKRFILQEEAFLEKAFPLDAIVYFKQVRRWI